jgi:hypothetical protein
MPGSVFLSPWMPMLKHVWLQSEVLVPRCKGRRRNHLLPPSSLKTFMDNFVGNFFFEKSIFEPLFLQKCFFLNFLEDFFWKLCQKLNYTFKNVIQIKKFKWSHSSKKVFAKLYKHYLFILLAGELFCGLIVYSSHPNNMIQLFLVCKTKIKYDAW